MPIRTRVLPSLPEASIEARRFVREAAAGDVQPQVLGDALLLTSELVTNAIRYGIDHGLRRGADDHWRNSWNGP